MKPKRPSPTLAKGSATQFSSTEKSRGGIPAYYQLYVQLAQLIRDGHYAPGDNIPSESEMTSHYNVSRVTVRKALKNLEQEGLVVRRRGARTCVADRVTSAEPVLQDGSDNNLVTAGLGGHAINLVVDWRVPPPKISAMLRLEKRIKCFYVCRLRKQGESPFSYSQLYVSPSAAKNLDVDKLGEEPVLVEIERSGPYAEAADQFLSATLAQDAAASALGVPVGSALIQLRRTLFDKEGVPFIFQESLYRPDQYEYNMRLSRDSTSSRPHWRHT